MHLKTGNEWLRKTEAAPAGLSEIFKEKGMVRAGIVTGQSARGKIQIPGESIRERYGKRTGNLCLTRFPKETKAVREKNERMFFFIPLGWFSASFSWKDSSTCLKECRG
ncbi:unknown [Clostridium sp. CAG:149]|nr:unknown [Clostridium sp. CAG:149]